MIGLILMPFPTKQQVQEVWSYSEEISSSTVKLFHDLIGLGSSARKYLLSFLPCVVLWVGFCILQATGLEKPSDCACVPECDSE